MAQGAVGLGHGINYNTPVNANRLLAALLLGLSTALSAAETPSLEQRVIEHTTPNGIRVLLLERHFSPTVAIRMMFRVGSVDEVGGKTGLAHMFEHMMFKGSKTLGTRDYKAEEPLLKEIARLHLDLAREKQKGERADQKKIGELIDAIRQVEANAKTFVVDNELWNLYEREGASTLNATTSRDCTQYILDLPSNKLKLWAILDSDRLKNPVFRQFYQERDVVKEERRMRVDTHPEGKLFESFVSSAYQSHPYRNPTIGWEADLDQLQVGDLTDFYLKHYTPDNLTISIVGDMNIKDTIALVDKYFGDWKAAAPERRHLTEEPPQTGERRTVIQFDAQPRMVMGFHLPAYPHPDQIVSYAVSHLLGSGSSSRLYKSLVEKKKVVTSIEVGQGYPGERYASLFIIAGESRFPHTSAEAIKVVEQELDRLKKEPVQEWELEKVRAAVEVGILDTLQTNGGMASTLAYNQAVFGDWKFLLRFQKEIRALKAQDIQRFANTYFVKGNTSVGILEPLPKKR